MVATSLPVHFTRLDATQFSQHTSLGPNSGTLIETDNIRLEPIQLEKHTPKLWNLYKNHQGLFQYFPHGPLATYEKFYAVQKNFCESKDFANWAVYLLVNNPSGDSEKNKTKILCGSICLLDIHLAFRRSEVGSIWFHPAVHGTTVMLETTYALLRFAFERLQCGRVQWKTHHLNLASQKAAAKLGFDEDGLHRKHVLNWDGQWRNTWFYSMTDDDWFGLEEVTTNARPGLEVGPTADRPADLVVEPKGRQLALENKIAERRKNGKAIPAGVLAGQPLEKDE
ncbi:hypothetical protein BGZ83_010403 [Gryganskiella cystojenkinii]|nr:hypothetical protein BGZ83_010403 [Gryganskiella cystojenkinii]